MTWSGWHFAVVCGLVWVSALIAIISDKVPS